MKNEVFNVYFNFNLILFHLS